MTYPELKALFRELKRTSPKKDLTAHIVFTEDSFDKPYPLICRTYLVSSDNKGFRPNMSSRSVFAWCLDKDSDQGVRLDWYMADEGNADGWKVQECYVLERMRDAVAIPNAERAEQDDGSVCWFFGDTCIRARESLKDGKTRLEPVSGARPPAASGRTCPWTRSMATARCWNGPPTECDGFSFHPRHGTVETSINIIRIPTGMERNHMQNSSKKEAHTMRFTHFTISQNGDIISTAAVLEQAVSAATCHAADTGKPATVTAHATNGTTPAAVFNPDGTNEGIWQIDKGEPLVPTAGQVYTNRGGGKFLCLSAETRPCPTYYNASGCASDTSGVFRNVKSGWTFTAKGIVQYIDGTIEWDHSTDGRFDKVPP